MESKKIISYELQAIPDVGYAVIERIGHDWGTLMSRVQSHLRYGDAVEIRIRLMTEDDPLRAV